MVKTIEELRERDRLRQARYYANNKEKIAARRKAQRAADRAIILEARAPLPEPELIEAPEEEPERRVVRQVAGKPAAPSNKKWTVEEIKDGLGKLEGVNPNTAKVYLQALSRLNKIFDLSNGLMPWLKKPQKFVDGIRNAAAAINTKKSNIQFAVYAIDKLAMPVLAKNKEVLKSYFDELKVVSHAETATKSATVVIPTWERYLKLIDDKFNKTSKENVLAHLYESVPVRDNFTNMRLITTKAERAEYNRTAYIGKNGIVEILIKDHKTVNKYGPIDEKLPAALSKQMTDYIAANKIKAGDNLFGKSPLGVFVKSANKKINVEGGIGLFRQMSTGNGTQTAAEQVAESRKKRHSTTAAVGYRRKKT